MAKKRPIMAERSDGRLYSRILRRCVVLLKHIKAGRKFDLIEIAREVQEEEYPEFQTRRGEQFVQIKAERIREYLAYLVDLQVIKGSDSKHDLSLAKPITDSHWAQTLSDIAREHISRMLNVSVDKLPTHLEDIRKRLHRKARVPTLAALLAEAGIEGTRREEIFRWSLYLYTDGDACPFELRQYPHLVTKE